MKTAEVTFLDLCDQVDYWKRTAEYWQDKYEQEIKERSIESHQRLIEAQKGVANVLMFALHVKDDENGNLVLNAESRKELSETLKY